VKNPSGFVPINFRIAGVLLLTLGILSLLCGIAAALTGWFAPGLLLILSVLLLLVGLYLLFAVPRGDDPAS
jgi:apolipoprotein N-acyltransferase